MAISRKSNKASNSLNLIPWEEWNFAGPQIAKPPIWQWNDWLNYEYARSCRPIVKAVLELRARKFSEREVGTWPPEPKFPRHAIYLERHYPDFPGTPWLQLPSSQPNIRKETSTPVDGPFEEGTLEDWDVFDFEYRIATGDLWLNPQSTNDLKYSVLKIDFLRDDRLIEKKFRHWLKGRKKQYLQARTTAIEKLAAGAAKPARIGKEVNSGQSMNVRNYTTAFKQLAALRLLEHFKYDYLKCADETTKNEGEKPLYNALNNTRWFDAANKATESLVRFNMMWELEVEPAYFFKFQDFHETIKWHPKMAADLKRIRDKAQLKLFRDTLFCGLLERQQLCKPG